MKTILGEQHVNICKNTIKGLSKSYITSHYECMTNLNFLLCCNRVWWMKSVGYFTILILIILNINIWLSKLCYNRLWWVKNVLILYSMNIWPEAYFTALQETVLDENECCYTLLQMAALDERLSGWMLSDVLNDTYWQHFHHVVID